MQTKQNMIDSKILPYLGQLPINEISAAQVRRWQGEMMDKGYKPTYLKSINNQLNAIFNYAVRYYDLRENPCKRAGSMGKSKADSMQFWTRDEFSAFVDCVTDKHRSYIIFMVLYWTGIREGELLALTPLDIDIKNRKIHITRSYQRIKGRDVITDPKTQKSRRVIDIPEFLAADLQDYMDCNYDLRSTDRLFPVTEYYINSELQRGIKLSGVKKIRVHDLRHSHVALLISMGYQAYRIMERMGHESIKTAIDTYGHWFPNLQQEMAEEMNRMYMEEL